MLAELEAPVANHDVTSFGWEPIEDLLKDGIADMVADHWEEVGVHKRDVPLSVDWDKYLAMERMGIIKVFAARRRGKLVGYSSFVIIPHLHYSTTLHATSDAIYVDQSRRGLGVRMIIRSEAAIADHARWLGYEHVRVIYHVKTEVEADRGTLAKVFERLGYKMFETCHDKIVRVE